MDGENRRQLRTLSLTGFRTEVAVSPDGPPRYGEGLKYNAGWYRSFAPVSEGKQGIFIPSLQAGDREIKRSGTAQSASADWKTVGGGAFIDFYRILEKKKEGGILCRRNG